MSRIDASSLEGVSGTVRVQSSISQAGGKIVPLSKSTPEVTALLNQRCAAVASGQYSSFVLAGRESLPAESGGWLMNPLIAAGMQPEPVIETGSSTREEPRRAEVLRGRPDETAALSLDAHLSTGKAGCGS